MSHNEDMERVHYVEPQKVRLSKLVCDGWILDVGGGGEGIIGQLNGGQVIAIDPNREELIEAAAGPLKIVMDAGNMTFLDEQFSMASSFFTMMYIDNEIKDRVFKEIYRVLKVDGEFLLWDLTIPAYNNGQEDIYAMPLMVEMDNKTIETGYGVIWSKREQNIDFYLKLGKENGFKVIEQREEDLIYFLRFRK